jgi:hypothetical protein
VLERRVTATANGVTADAAPADADAPSQTAG